MSSKNRPRPDRVVYMYLNTVTELVYVGSSLYGIEYRHRHHMRTVRSSKARKCRFHRALAEWPEELWVRVVLERCADEEQLDAAERRWISTCCSLDAGVGYNTYDAHYMRQAVAGGEAMRRRGWSEEERVSLAERGRLGGLIKALQKSPARVERERKRAEFAAMTDEQRREYFRECGRRGAAKSRQPLGG